MFACVCARARASARVCARVGNGLWASHMHMHMCMCMHMHMCLGLSLRSPGAWCIAPVLPLEEVRLARSLGAGAHLITVLVGRELVVA